MLPLLNMWTFVRLSIIVNIGNRPELNWVLTAFDWLQNSMNLCLKIFLINCKNLRFNSKNFDLLPKTLIYCQNILISCQKFPTMLITSIKNALDSTLHRSSKTNYNWPRAASIPPTLWSPKCLVRPQAFQLVYRPDDFFTAYKPYSIAGTPKWAKTGGCLVWC